ncbi:MAG: hypothetical protein IT161_02775 [Bryobacterales bacterium]|nr:hypothetical protein [Bryobacterales bacterium]
MRWRLVVVLALAPGAPRACAEMPTLLDRSYAQMYNLDFSGAHRTLAEWMRQNPGDPLGPVSDAAAHLFEQLDRLRILQSELFTNDDAFQLARRPNPDPAAIRTFEDQLKKADALANEALSRNPRDTNALFAQVLSHGLRSDMKGLIEKNYLTSLSLAKAGRVKAEQLLSIDPSFQDAWIAVGVENYMLSLKPLPLRWLLQLGGNQTDRDVGVARLRMTAERGRYLKPFARLLLAVAALRDRDKNTARTILSDLKAQFPGNRLYAEELARIQ